MRWALVLLVPLCIGVSSCSEPPPAATPSQVSLPGDFPPYPGATLVSHDWKSGETVWTTTDTVDTVVAFYAQNLTMRDYVQKSAITIQPENSTAGPGRPNGGDELTFQKSKITLVVKVVALEQESMTRITVDLG